jgi:hypothetical protein
MAAELGEALTGIYSISGGTAQLFERGVVVTGAAGPVVDFAFLMIGRPHIATATSTAGTATVLDPSAVTFGRGSYDLAMLGPLVRAALAGRVGVVPPGESSAPQVLTAGPVEILVQEEATRDGGVIPAHTSPTATSPGGSTGSGPPFTTSAVRAPQAALTPRPARACAVEHRQRGF